MSSPTTCIKSYVVVVSYKITTEYAIARAASLFSRQGIFLNLSVRQRENVSNVRCFYCSLIESVEVAEPPHITDNRNLKWQFVMGIELHDMKAYYDSRGK
mgnify:CR=1 FL=1